MSSYEKTRNEILVRSTMIMIMTFTFVIGIINTAIPVFAYTRLCSGSSYSVCINKGYTDHGYGSHNQNSYWGAYPGHNCTNYVAYVETQNGVPQPSFKLGNANQWWSEAQGHVKESTTTPAVGSVAWWNANQGGVGKDGHVAYVEAVSGNAGSYVITISEDAYPIGPFDWVKIAQGDSRWPGGFIYFGGSPTPSDPVAVSRASTNMAVFYDDGNGGLVSWSWDVNSGWSSYTWHDTFGTNGSDYINGQPCVVARDANDMDVFYRTAQGRLIHRGWNATNGWEGPDVLVSGSDVGDPACVTRDSGDLQAFYRTSVGEIKSVNWNWQSGWNLNPQLLYNSSATNDPVAISRTSDSMDVFFGKNNGNLVHLGWTATYGWNTQDWGAGSGVAGKPTAISRNGGGDMSADYMESNGKLAEEFWNWQTGWGWQDWNAQLVGSPSAIPGVAYTIEVFYRETGGNIVDHYFNGTNWAATWIVGAGGATGNPYAIVRGSNEDVFYWNNSTLMDADWNSINGWTTAQVR